MIPSAPHPTAPHAPTPKHGRWPWRWMPFLGLTVSNINNAPCTPETIVRHSFEDRPALQELRKSACERRLLGTTPRLRDLTLSPRSMNFTATSSPDLRCRISFATPKFPDPRSLIWHQNDARTHTRSRRPHCHDTACDATAALARQIRQPYGVGAPSKPPRRCPIETIQQKHTYELILIGAGHLVPNAASVNAPRLGTNDLASGFGGPRGLLLEPTWEPSRQNRG